MGQLLWLLTAELSQFNGSVTIVTDLRTESVYWVSYFSY